jgi:hypothetical protein
MNRIMCECCNKKIRPIKNNDNRERQWANNPNLKKLCKSCYNMNYERCSNCSDRYYNYYFVK